MKIPTQKVRLSIEVVNAQAFAEFARSLGVSGDQPLANQVLQACVTGQRKTHEAGYSIEFAAVVSDVESSIFDVEMDIHLARPEVLNEVANAAFAQMAIDVPVNSYPSVSGQIGLEVEARARRCGVDPGIKVSSDANENQEGVSLAWVYPDEDGDRVPAYVDPLSGYISHCGSLPEDFNHPLVRKRVETQDEVYEVVNVVTDAEHSFWVLRPSAFREFARRLADSDVNQPGRQKMGEF